jgi:hypothetical protein
MVVRPLDRVMMRQIAGNIRLGFVRVLQSFFKPIDHGNACSKSRNRNLYIFSQQAIAPCVESVYKRVKNNKKTAYPGAPKPAQTKSEPDKANSQEMRDEEPESRRQKKICCGRHWPAKKILRGREAAPPSSASPPEGGWIMVEISTSLKCRGN